MGQHCGAVIRASCLIFSIHERGKPFLEDTNCFRERVKQVGIFKDSALKKGGGHLDPGCAIFVRDFFRWSVFGIMTKLMGSPKTHGVTGYVGIREF